MRLSKKEIEVIISALKRIDDKAEIYLFGSRAKDENKGGDIDLLILSEKMNFDDKLKFKKYLFDEMDEQKIDVIISSKKQLSKDAFKNMAYKEGIKLIND
jgi:uncharacterized protein